MIAVVQRVKRASVLVSGSVVGAIGEGIVALVGVFADDTKEDAVFLARRCVNLRIFEDSECAMNLSLADIGGSVLAVSQFTLCANARKGRRPSFTDAMPPEEAIKIYDVFCDEISTMGIPVSKGVFREHMLVEIFNDGPVTFILNSRESRRGNIKEEK